MKAFQEADAKDPAIAKLKEITVRHATEAGGLTLAIWRLAQGQFFGEPMLMSLDEVAKQLEMPLSEVRRIVTETDERIRAEWRRTSEYRGSRYDRPSASSE
jgi:NADH:ubiquinone oxidoreductase subunit E